ncbi:type III-B CRISPR-associated protein Cas10/Cmr2 [Betaproteobacteria bacterium]|nr:type III-B CRISPR-associated protein Cas10/Cmr2 [Betaproteobacteria bacterium]
MNNYLFVLALGPVQTFIAAARRSRDLWSGSWLLSEISKAAAQALQECGVELIFPAPGSDLRPGSEISVGNKVQCIVHSATKQDLQKLASDAGEAARQRFHEIAVNARDGLKLRDNIWDQQIDDYVESFAAWASIADDDYGKAVTAANAVLAARKATRDFRPSAVNAEEAPAYGLPKSSLDGARETVLPEEKSMTPSVRRRLGLNASEQLDCAGIAKRLGGDVDQFTPFSRIAAHAWIDALPGSDRELLREAYEPLVQQEFATRVKGNKGCHQDFPYDAQLLYRSRLDAALRDAKEDEDARKALETLRNTAQPLWKKYGEPCPYGAILLADGDRMGALLSETHKSEQHIEITQALSSFAAQVPDIVREFSGHAIYAGGDDVLAFLPLHLAFQAANALQKAFADALQRSAKSLGAKNQPTLSVGLAIGHLMEPLGNLRQLAKDAEAVAKGDDRNALGIALRIRSGGLTKLRLRWDDNNAHAAFERWQKAYRSDSRQLPTRLAYDARQIHQRTAFALVGADPKRDVQRFEFERLLSRARTDDGKALTDEWRDHLRNRLQDLQSSRLPTALAVLADELIVSRWLAARSTRDLGDAQ